MRLTVMYNQAQALRKWNKKKYSHHVHWDTKAWVRSVLIRLVSWSSAWRKFWLTLVKTFVKCPKCMRLFVQNIQASSQFSLEFFIQCFFPDPVHTDCIWKTVMLLLFPKMIWMYVVVSSAKGPVRWRVQMTRSFD